MSKFSSVSAGAAGDDRQQMRGVLTRLVDLSESGLGPIRSFESMQQIAKQARAVLALPHESSKEGQ